MAFPTFEKQSLTGRGKVAKGSLDFDLDSLLGDESGPPKSKTNTKRKSQTGSKKKTTKQVESIGRTKRNPVASRDDDFYASLAAEADEEEVAVTEEDAQKIASNMADMDDLDSDLFASSLVKKKNRFGQRRKNEDRKIKPIQEEQMPPEEVKVNKPREEKVPVQPKKSSGFDFDDDDILADILASSDEDDRKFRPKRKRKETGVVPTSSEKNETKEIKEDDKPESLLSRMSPKLRRSALGGDKDDVTQKNEDLDVPPEKPPEPPMVNKEVKNTNARPRSRGQKDQDLFGVGDDDFDGDDMLDALGFDSAEKPQERKASSRGDLFGKGSRFDELLGKSEPTPVESRPPTRGKRQLEVKPEKKIEEKTEESEEDDFQFGGYTPTVGKQKKEEPIRRPRTAPTGENQRVKSVRFADDVEEKEGGEENRPFSSPSVMSNVGKPRERKSRSDWLGMEAVDEPIKLSDLGESNVLTLDEKEEEEEEEEKQVAPSSPPTKNNTFNTSRPNEDLFGDDFGLGLGSSRGRRSSSRRRKEEPQTSLFPWEQSKSKSRQPAREDLQLKPEKETHSRPPPSTSHHSSEEDVLVAAPARRSTHLMDSEPAGGLAVSQANAVAMANAAAEGRESVLREEIEKLRGEAKGLKERIGELETKSNEQEKKEIEWNSERETLKGRIESERDENTQQKRKAGEKEKELLSKIHVLEVEKGQLEALMQAAEDRHQKELNNMESVHKSRTQTLEASFHRQEERLREELERQASQHNARLVELEQAKSAVVATYEKKLAESDQEHVESMERLKEIHKSLADELKKEHEKEKRRQEKLHQQELAAVSEAHSHTRSLQELIAHVKQSTESVSEMQQRVDMAHSVGFQEREQALRSREEQLKSLEERLTKQQIENEQERVRLHGLVAKMEARMRDQTRQIEQERWKLQQDESRVQALQRVLDEDRVTSAELLSREREELQKAKGKLLEEQQSVLSQCYAERRELAHERTQLSISQKMKRQVELESSSRALETEAELKAELESVKRQSSVLAEKRQALLELEEKLGREKREVESEKEAVSNERAKVQELRIKLKEAADEVSRLEEHAVASREEGRQALHEATLMKGDVEQKVNTMMEKKAELQDLERRLAQERIELVHQRKDLTKLRDEKNAGSVIAPPGGASLTRTPHHHAPIEHHHATIPVDPKAMLNLEYSRVLRLWAQQAEKELDELEEENQFLESLHGDPEDASSLLP